RLEAVEHALEECEQRFRAVWQHAADAMVLSSPDGIIQLVNPACCALYGRSADELIGQNLTLIFAETEQAGGLFAAPEPPPTFRKVVRHGAGAKRTVECRAEFLSQNGTRVGLITIIRDVSNRVRRADLDARFASLTPRELDVLRQIATGKTNPEIGRVLGLSSKAARNRVAHGLAKLGVADRTSAAVLAA